MKNVALLNKLLIKIMDINTLAGERDIAVTRFLEELKKFKLHSLLIVGEEDNNWSAIEGFWEILSNNLELLNQNTRLRTELFERKHGSSDLLGKIKWILRDHRDSKLSKAIWEAINEEQDRVLDIVKEK